MITNAQLAGTWKLISLRRELTATGAQTIENRTGFITFGPGNRVMTILVGKDRKAPADELPTDLERIALHKSLIAFAGTYAVEPERIVIHVEASWNETWTGSEQVRSYSRDGDRMIFRTEPHRSATDGLDSVYIQVWEKIA